MPSGLLNVVELVKDVDVSLTFVAFGLTIAAAEAAIAMAVLYPEPLADPAAEAIEPGPE